jgi:peptide/nickel transport system permease protein
MKRQRTPVFALTVLAVFVLVALLAPWLAPHDPEVGRLAMRNKPPAWIDGGSTQFLLGTDHLGRDVLSRLIHGARVSLAVGFAAVLVAGGLGTTLGLVAGYFRGWVDQLISRVIDAWLALPSLVFAIFLAAITAPSTQNIVLILAAVYWTRYARVVRSEVLSLRERDFVRLAQVAGASPARIIFRHILPNVINTVVVLATLMLGVVIVTEASLSFLGVGVPPPQPAWGLMLADGKKGLMTGYWWLTVFPGLAIMLVVLAASLAGDWLRDRLDPKLGMPS